MLYTPMIHVYIKLFNRMLGTEYYPATRLRGIVRPIYKVTTTEPKNYRPITLLCCISKLFTSVDNRLTAYLESSHTLSEIQTGFRKGYSTCDHIFTLYIC